MRSIRLGVLGTAFLFAAGANAGDAVWTSSGPLGGRVHEIVFDPGNPNKAYATTWGGVFRSADGGLNWSRASDGIVADTIYPLPLMLDAELPNKLYTFDSWARIYRTDNGGNNWAILPNSLPSDVVPAALADKPGFGCVVLLGTATVGAGDGPMLFKSTDCGFSFFQIGAGIPADVAVKAIAFDPTDATHNTLLVGIDGAGSEGDAIYRSTDGGASFVATASTFFPGGGYRPEVTQLSFGASGEVWALVGNYSVFHSSDGGLSWTDTMYFGASSVIADPGITGKAWIGSTDEVASVQFDGSLYNFTSYADGLTANASYDNGVRSIPAGVDRLAWRLGASPRLFASSEGSGIFVLDETPPATWAPVTTSPAGAGIRALAIHPGDPQQLLAGQSTFSVSSPALYASSNSGLAWAPANSELNAADIQALRVDPTTSADVATTTVYAGGRSATAFSDDFRNHGLYRSDDGGANWQNIAGDLPTLSNHDFGAIRHLALDPESCTAPPCTTANGPLQRVYAVGHGRTERDVNTVDDSHRVIRSNDRGSTWVALDGNPGFPRSSRVFTARQRVTPTVIVVDPADPQRLYVGTEAEFVDSNTGDEHSIDPARASGLFRSSDGGATWQRFTNLPTKIDTATYANASLDVVDLLIEPGNSNVLWLAMRDLFASNTSTILRSADAGATWQPADAGLYSSLELRDLAFDPQNPHILYATMGGNGANPGAVLRGVWNPGTTSIQWLSISVGLPAESAYTIAVDPTNPNLLHAGTDTGVHSILRAPDQDGDGIPDATEDQAPDVPGGIIGPGDGNGDGQMDSAQRDVGSSVVIFRRGGGSSAVTSTIVSGTGPGANACSQAVDVSLLPPETLTVDLDPLSGQTYGHPLAARQFDITQCATAVVDITYHGADFSTYGWSFRYFGPADPGDADEIGWFHWTQAQRIGASTWRVQLTANAFGSYRPEPDAIRFVGGPACLDDRLLGDGFESNPTTMTGCAE